MIQNNPFLKINRLLIYSNQGNVAYDEIFHDGVNIIRGHNSSGKSTIINFIFYVLGGDYKKWTSAALQCSDVYAEVFINSAPLTLKRKISDTGMQPMYIFWGMIKDALSSASEGWFVFPYKRSIDKKSFSNVLFLALGFPELRGDVDSNITMNQILRLLYIDQKSLTLDLLMSQSFDSSITRKTIADLLFGVYDDSLYSDQISLIESKKELDFKTVQLGSIQKIYLASDNEINSEQIDKQIEENNRLISKIEYEYNLLKIQDKNINIEFQDSNNKIIEVEDKLSKEKDNLANLQSQINSYNLELLDSQDFIESLEKRALALSDSSLTREVFKDLKMTHCPNCLLPLIPITDDYHCELCNQILPQDRDSSQLKRMQQEIDNQIRESKKIFEQKKHEYLTFQATLPYIIQNLNFLQRELNELLNSFKSDREQGLEDLLIEKGSLISKNEHLVKQLKAIVQLEVLKKEIEVLKITIHRLNENINKKIIAQTNKLSVAYNSIQEYSLMLLHNDIGRQREFNIGSKIELDFEKNTFSLDGENNFSESSNVYLKNSVRFGIFFASLKEAFFRLPRFILCDNIEDKGMEPTRSQRFQHELVNLSLESDVRHQMIFTTSMISSELNNSEYCIGDFYTEENKTLKL